MTTMTARSPRKAAHPIQRPIRSRAELEQIIVELDDLIDGNPKTGTAEHDRMELLALLIGAYEAEHVPPPAPVTPQQMVKFMAEQKNVSPGELAELLGGRSRLSDFYNHRRPLSTGQIIRLRERLGIPADLLISFRRAHRTQ